jgi:hypothetical protein
MKVGAQVSTCEDLRRQFEKDASLRRQSFYNALHHAKGQGWIVGGGSPHNQNQLYTLNPDGSWKELASNGEGIGEAVGLDKDRLEYLVESRTQQIDELQSEIERLRDWSGGDDANGSGVAIPSLIRIITDSASTVRQKLKGAETILNYRVEDASVVEFTKKFLQSVCTSADVATDYRVEAAGLLRRCESPRVTPDSVRPTYREEAPKEPGESLRDTVARRRARADRMELEAIEQLRHIPSEQPQLLALLASRNGNGGDEH